MFFSQPTNSSAVGVAIYVNNSLNYCERSDLSYICDDVETIWIEIKNPKAKNILCYCVYRHPSTDPRKVRQYFESIFSKIPSEMKLVYIMGNLKKNCLTAISTLKLMSFSIRCVQIIFFPRITATSAP